MTQGDPLPSTLFNLVVGAVVCNWLTIVEEEEAGPAGLGKAIQRMASFFYADDYLITSTWTKWLQGGFDVLKGLLGNVGRKTNVGKTVGMVC